MNLYRVANRVAYWLWLLFLGVSVGRANAANTDDLVKALQRNDSRGAQAYESLLKAPDAAPALRSGLASSDRNVRRRCAKLAGQRKDSDLLPDLVKAADDKEGAVREAVAEALGHFGKPARPYLVKLMQDSQVSVRLAAAQGVISIDGKLGPEAAALRIDPSEIVRTFVAYERAEQGDLSAREEARSALESKSYTARHFAFRALGLVGNDSDLARLKRIENDSSEDLATRNQAADAAHALSIRQKHEDTAEKLAPYMRDPSLNTRRWAAAELLRIRDKGGLDALKQIAADPNHPGQGEAATALSTIGNRGI